MISFEEWCARWHVPVEAVRELVMPPAGEVYAPVPTSEAAVQAAVRLAAPRIGVRLWRNNSGACRDDTGRMIRYGLGNDSQRINQLVKSSDLIGVDPRGRFVAVECKAPTWRGNLDAHGMAQARFLAIVQQAGGIGGFVRSVEEFYALFR